MEKNYAVIDIKDYEEHICRFYDHIMNLEKDADHYRDLYHRLHDAVIETIEYISSETEGDKHYAVVDTNKFLTKLEAAAEYVPMRMTFDEPEAETEAEFNSEPPEGGNE